MNYDRLKSNIIDFIKEEQLKLGYRREVVRLYYPLSSLCHFFGQDCGAAEMEALLMKFCDSVKDELGKITVNRVGERFCLAVSEEGAEYVHGIDSGYEFLAQLIDTVRCHGCTMEDVLALFDRYSDKVHSEKLDNGEFDWLVYFEDGTPDGYYYCFTSDEFHTTYHRFLPKDYADFGF